jgi:hypothetical protein
MSLRAAGLPATAVPSRLWLRERGRQDLHRDMALQPLIPRPVHLPHPARANGREDLVRAEPRADCQGHVDRNYRPRMAPPTPVVEGPDA